MFGEPAGAGNSKSGPWRITPEPGGSRGAPSANAQPWHDRTDSRSPSQNASPEPRRRGQNDCRRGPGPASTNGRRWVTREWIDLDQGLRLAAARGGMKTVPAQTSAPLAGGCRPFAPAPDETFPATSLSRPFGLEAADPEVADIGRRVRARRNTDNAPRLRPGTVFMPRAASGNGSRVDPSRKKSPPSGIVKPGPGPRRPSIPPGTPELEPHSARLLLSVIVATAGRCDGAQSTIAPCSSTMPIGSGATALADILGFVTSAGLDGRPALLLVRDKLHPHRAAHRWRLGGMRAQLVSLRWRRAALRIAREPGVEGQWRPQ